MKKRFAFAAVIAAAAVITAGCGNSELNDAKLSKPEPPNIVTQAPTTEHVTELTTENKEKSLDERIVDELSPVTWDYDEQTLAVKTVGNDEFGYISVPVDWFLAEDVSALSDDVLTYENEPYINNGNYAMDSMIMETCDADYVNSKVESVLRIAEEDQSVTEVAYEYADIDGKNAVIVKFKYDELHKLMCSLFIANDDETMLYVVSYESSNPQIVGLIDTFTRTAPEEMTTDTTETSDSATTADTADTTDNETDTTSTTTTAVG